MHATATFSPKSGVISINNAKYAPRHRPHRQGNAVVLFVGISAGAYVRHLLVAKEMLGMRLAVMHNLWFYNNLYGVK